MNASLVDVVLLTPGPRGRVGLPTIFVGMPGCGKTSLLEAASRRHALRHETVLLSIREPADVGGLPVVSPEGVRLEPPSWARRLAAPLEVGENGGVFFADELSCCAPSTQAAALRVVAEGVVGDLALPPHVRVLAAANPEEVSAGGWTLAAPLANRLLHVDQDSPTGAEWAEWISGDGGRDESKPPVMEREAWERAWALSRSHFAAFARRFPDKLLQVPKTDAERGRAWPSPRSFELAARAWAGAKALGASDGVQLRLVKAAIGDGAAAEVFAYLRDLDLPDPEEILAGRAAVPLARPDQAYASLAGVVATAMVTHAEQHERLTRSLEIAKGVAATLADVAVACVRPLFKRATLLGPVLSSARHGKRAQAAIAGPLAAVGKMLSEG